jgi:transposase-like protein
MVARNPTMDGSDLSSKNNSHSNTPSSQEASAPAVRRARPGKRSVEERQQAVVDLLAGKATAEQIAKRLCVLPETVLGWKQEAMEAMSAAFRQGRSETARERELHKQNTQLQRAVSKLVVEKEILQTALELRQRPTGPGR